MPLIIRIDVDRPYGRRPLVRHFLSRVSSDLYFPKIPALGFLTELRTMLEWLNDEQARAYVFFRRCTLPSRSIIELLDAGRHVIGLHLENSRTFETFIEEKRLIEEHFGRRVFALSKHGSGGAKYGRYHYPPYEPQRYIEWAHQMSMGLFLGNGEDPSVGPLQEGNGLLVYPSAFWLEPTWRDVEKFPVDWLLDHGRERDIVLLVHPENVLAQPELLCNFSRLVKTLKTRHFQ